MQDINARIEQDICKKVLKKMLDQGKISQKEHEEIIAQIEKKISV